MKVGYFEAMITPFSVITNDLEMQSLFNQYGQKHEESPNTQGVNNGSTRIR